MIEATTNAELRHAATEAHIQRSLAAWRMIDAVRALPALLLTGHAKGAAHPDGPHISAGCAA